MSQSEVAYTVGKQLVEWCNAGKGEQVIQELYADDVVSIEAFGNEQMPQRMEGKETILGKNAWWRENHEVHALKVEGPFPHGDRFACKFFLDVTSKPMGNKRMQMEEIGLYTVQDGKIVQEEFFYHMDCPE